MIRISMILLIYVMAWSFSSPVHALEIQNFRSGLVCELEYEMSDLDWPIEWICFETETVYITGQGRCVWDGEDKHCTWYGYEFDYTGATGEEEITCSMTSELPFNEGSPAGVSDKNITNAEWSYSLEPGDGHHYKPNYSVFGPQDEYESLNTTSTTCSLDGKELYQYRMTRIYPAMQRKDIENSLRQFYREFEKIEESIETEDR